MADELKYSFSIFKVKRIPEINSISRRHTDMKSLPQSVECFLLLTLMFAFGAIRADCAEESLNEAELKLFATLPDQTGNTDGYPMWMKYNIDQCEPAHSIIRLRARAIPELLKRIHDRTPTKAHWFARSGKYSLTVADVAICILQHVGGADELKILKRRLTWLEKLLRDTGEYVSSQKDWTPEEKAEYWAPFRELEHSKVITIWAIDMLSVHENSELDK